MESNKTIASVMTKKGNICIYNERITAEEYIEFLARTDLGQQYPKERFRERINKLVTNTAISILAKDDSGKIIGICFGITDYAYWLLVTDIGVDRDYTRSGIGKELIGNARRMAGSNKDIVVFIYANEEAIGFYEKMGLKKSKSMMELTEDIEWTEFEVGKDAIE